MKKTRSVYNNEEHYKKFGKDGRISTFCSTCENDTMVVIDKLTCHLVSVSSRIYLPEVL